jgi:hypothetical protein
MPRRRARRATLPKLLVWLTYTGARADDQGRDSLMA